MTSIKMQAWRTDRDWDWDYCLTNGPSLILKKGSLHKARLGYTPLVEVKQAVVAWSV